MMFLNIVSSNLHHYTIKTKEFIVNNPMENGGKRRKISFQVKQTLFQKINNNVKKQCQKSLIKNNDINNLRLSNDQIELKTPETMKNIVEQGIAHQYSLYNMKNIFWKYP